MIQVVHCLKSFQSKHTVPYVFLKKFDWSTQYIVNQNCYFYFTQERQISGILHHQLDRHPSWHPSVICFPSYPWFKTLRMLYFGFLAPYPTALLLTSHFTKYLWYPPQLRVKSLISYYKTFCIRYKMAEVCLLPFPVYLFLFHFTDYPKLIELQEASFKRRYHLFYLALGVHFGQLPVTMH